MSSPPSNYTCTACDSYFYSAEEQREHYKLDWHRYNLKRKVAGLAPSNLGDFEARLAAAAKAQPQEAFKGQCAECRKSFSSEGLYRQHLASKRHRITLQQLAKKRPSAATATAAAEAAEASADGEEEGMDDGVDSASEDVVELAAVELQVEGEHTAAAANPPAAHSDPLRSNHQAKEASLAAIASTANNVETADVNGGGDKDKMEEVEDEEEADGEKGDEDALLAPEVCVFCEHVSAGVEANCKHMLQRHGFFIPDAEYLVDLAGLVAYLNEKVKLGGVCLYCNGKGRGFHSRRAVQQHMEDSSHCKLLYEEGEDLHEFEPFYDFSPSYLQEGQNDDDLVQVVSRPRKSGTADDTDASAGSSGEISEDGSAEEAPDNDEDDEELVVKRRIHVTDLGELALLDGRVVGHRELRRYYKQRLPSEDTRDAILEQRRAQQQRLLAMYGEAGHKSSSSVALRAAAGRLLPAMHRLPAAARNARSAGVAARRVEDKERLKRELKQNKLNRTYRKVHEC